MNIINSIKIICWNANGLSNKKADFATFLHLNDIDIALISESHCTSYINRPKIQNYSVYLANHPTDVARGGSAVFIKDSLYHYDVGAYVTDSIQASIIAIHLADQLVHIGSIYCPPRCPPQESDFNELFQHLGPRWILGGDFNAKHPNWGSRLISPRGRVLNKVSMRHLAYPVSSGSPTYWPSDLSKLPDVIDFFLIKGLPSCKTKAENMVDLTSDHVPILLTVSMAPLPALRKQYVVNKTTDWDSYRQLVSSKINLQTRPQTEEELDLLASSFSTTLHECIQLSTNYDNSPMNTMEHPNYLRNLIRCRRKARKAWQRNRTATNKLLFNQLCKKTSKAISEWKNNSFEAYLTSLAPTKEAGYSLWKAAKNIRRPVTFNSPLRNEDGSWARCDLDKAELFCRHFENTFQDNEISSQVELTLPQCNVNDNEIIRPTSPMEVAQLIDKLNKKKSAGSDDVLPCMISELPRKAIIYMTNLFNAALRLRYVPSCWKKARMIVILKPGKPVEEPKSYRPISLLPVVSKIFEKAVRKRLEPYIIEENLIPDIQFGFREKHSTVEQIHRIVKVITQAFEEKEYAPAVFLDVSSAFDKVWHKGLIHKLHKFFSPGMCKLLASYLNKRTFYVQVGAVTSRIATIEAGVPQGSVLGPLLYLLYTYDFPVFEGIITALFADDAGVIVRDKSYESAVNKLQAAVDIIHEWANDWKIKLNESKSVRVDFALRRHGYIPTTMNDKPVPLASSARYLGLHLDCKLNWHEHIRIKRDHLNLLFRQFQWLIGRHSNISLANKRLIYQSIFVPTWAYGCEIWGTTRASNRLVIERFQNKMMRAITRAPWFIRNDDLRKDLRLESVKEVIAAKAHNYIERLHRHPNVEAIALLDVSTDVRRLKRTHCTDL